MTRIAIVCEPPDGGVAEHVRQLALGLPRHGYEPVIIVPRDFAHLDELGRVSDVVTTAFRRDYKHPRDELRVLASLVRVVRETELVHAHSSKAGVLGRVAAIVARRPAVYTPHAFPFVGEMSRLRRRFGVVMEHALAPATAVLICVCESERKLAIEHGLRLRRTELVYNGCPPCSDGDVAEMPSGLVVGAVSVLRRQKALEYLIDAMPAILVAVPEARLVIAGQGPQEAELRAHAANLGIDVAWLPFEPPSGRYLRGFDVYVLSSVWEAFPIAVLEALACGVPQVVSAVGGTPEAVVPETGVVVPPGDPAALAGAVTQLLRDPQRRAAMGEASRARHAENFTVERMVARTAAVYDRVLLG